MTHLTKEELDAVIASAERVLAQKGWVRAMTARRKDAYTPAQLALGGITYVKDLKHVPHMIHTEPRPTNAQLARAFRSLLTEGFYTTYTNGERAAPDSRTHNIELAATKPWRGDLWRAFAEIERRLCPTTTNGAPR